MNKVKKIAIITACSLIGLGVILTGAAVAVNGTVLFHTPEAVLNTINIEKSFENIDIDSVECDVQFIKSENGECRIESVDEKNIVTEAEVRDSTLYINRIDKRKWYESIGVYFGYRTPRITVFLPETEYEKLSISSASGDTCINGDFSFEDAAVRSSSGDIEFLADVLKNAEIKSASGDISVNTDTESLTVCSTSGDVTVEGKANKVNVSSNSGEVWCYRIDSEGEFNAKTTSGDVNVYDSMAATAHIQSTSGDVVVEKIGADKLSFKTTSGDIELEEVYAENMLTATAVSGDIEFMRGDSKDISFETVSGDIEGILSTGKNFSYKTTSGNIRLPDDSGDGKCYVKTVSGNAEIKIAW